MNDTESIRFECSNCQKRLRIAAKAAGKRLRCPKCTKVVEVPMQSEVEEERSEPAAPRLIWPWLAGGIAVMVLLGALGIWLVTGLNRRTSPSDSPQVVADQKKPCQTW
jgi:phage FluMu protein Com